MQLPVLLFVFGGLVLWVVFSVTWLVQLRTRNAAIVDAVWSASFSVLAVLYAALSDGYIARRILIAGMVVIWGLRLGGYLLMRTIGHSEDGRYTALREKWGKHQNWLMLRFYYTQAILALILSIPFALIAANPQPSLTWVEFAGASLWLIGVGGESTADWQLKNYKKDKANRGKVCNVGLWKYSRHPNYFFEWLVWVAYFIFALGSPWGFTSIICPAAMLYFLLRVTGIPYTEELLIKSRGAAYEAYRKTTSPFIPWPRKIS